MVSKTVNKKRRTALVTGAGSRLARVLVPELIRRGYDVVAASRSKIDFDVAEYYEWVPFNITRQADCERVVYEATRQYRGIDLMIICNGYYPQQASFAAQPVEELLLDIDVSFRGPVLLSKYFFDANRVYRTGDIVHVSSCAGHMNTLTADRIGYCANKAGINRFSENLNEAVKPFGLRAFNVIPWNLSQSEDRETLQAENALSYSALSAVMLDMVEYAGNAQVSTVEVKASFGDG